MTEWTTQHYKRWLTFDAQRVVREATRELANTILEPEHILERRRLMLLSKAYAPCSHMKKGRG